jgi:predicted transcriptional regulator
MPTTASDAVVSVRLGQETLVELDKLAEAMDRSRSYVIVQAVREFVERESASLSGIVAGEAEVAAGRGIPHEQASRWIDDLTAGKGRPKALRR